MRKLFGFAVSGTTIVLAAMGLASAQAPMSMPSAPVGGGSGQKARNLSQSTVYAPSDIAASGAQDERRSRGRQGNLLSASSGMGQPLAEGQLNLPRLCFQPGVGWTTAPTAAFMRNDGSTQNAGPIQNDGSKGKASGEGAAGANPGLQIRHGVTGFGALHPSSECPTMLLPQDATIATGQDSSPQNSASRFMNPSLTSGADLSQYNTFQTLMPDHPLSGIGSSGQAKPAFDFPEGLKGSRTHDVRDPNFALEQLKVLRRRAYISDVKLRRLSRNPQNIETRLELRRMNTEVEKRKKTKRAGEDQDTSTGKGNGKSNKHIDSMDLVARKAECQKKGDASKSKVCSLLKRVM